MSLEVGIPLATSAHSADMAAWLEKARLWKCFVTAKNRTPASRNGSFIEHQIAAWVTKQRREFKIGVIDQEKIQILNDADFEWSVDFDLRWNECFAALQIFLREKDAWPRLRGDSSREMRLAGWVAGQRAAIRDGRIRQDRLDKLNGFFAWRNLSERTPKWERSFKRWIAFVDGGKRVPRYDAACPEERSLYRWIDRQRNQRRNGNLSNERVEQLTAAGFSWSAVDH